MAESGPKSLALTPGEKREPRERLNVRAQAQVTGSGLGFGPQEHKKVVNDEPPGWQGTQLRGLPGRMALLHSSMVGWGCVLQKATYCPPGVVPHEGTGSRYWGTLAALDPELRAAGRSPGPPLRWLHKGTADTGREGCFPTPPGWELEAWEPSPLDGHNRWGGGRRWVATG